MHRGISLHMTGGRRRNQDLLEATVSCLRGLETARERQERLVLNALEVQDKEDVTQRWQQKPLQPFDGGLKDLLQQLSELRVDSNTDDNLDSPSSSGFYEQSEIQSPPKHSRSFPCLSFYSHKQRSLEEAYAVDCEGQKELVSRAFLPRSLSAPFTALEGIAEGTEEEEDDDNNDLWSKGQASNEENLNITEKVDMDGDLTGVVDELCEVPNKEVDESPTTEDIQQVVRVEDYILDILKCCTLKPTAASTWPVLDAYSRNYCNAHADSWHQYPVENEGEHDENGSHEGHYLHNRTGPFSLACEDMRSSVEKDQYGVMETCEIDSMNSHYIHSYVSPPLSSESVRQEWPSQSVEVAHRRHLPRLYQKPTVGESYNTTFSQSQSDGTFLHLETEYHTAGQNMNAQYTSEDYMSSQRLWSSSGDLSQGETSCMLRYKPHFHTLPQSYAQSHHLGNGMSTGATRVDGSDSSLSDPCSPGSSSMTSDSDESGGLVWPQQLPPCLSSFSQVAPSAVVKIKASHALKKKIMRFRSGTLKVMTTV